MELRWKANHSVWMLIEKSDEYDDDTFIYGEIYPVVNDDFTVSFTAYRGCGRTHTAKHFMGLFKDVDEPRGLLEEIWAFKYTICRG